MADDVSGDRRRRCWHRCYCSCLSAFDDNNICSHRDTTRLYEKRVVDLIATHPMLLRICIDVDTVIAWKLRQC